MRDSIDRFLSDLAVREASFRRTPSPRIVTTSTSSSSSSAGDRACRVLVRKFSRHI